MLTLYIHCLEVLAMKAEGQTVNTIVQMGCEWSPQRVVAALKDLEKEGYVKRWKVGRTTVWTILEKAREYCERIARLYAESHVMDDIADHVRGLENVALEGAKEVISGDLSTPSDTILPGGEKHAPTPVTEVFESMTEMIGDECAYCERRYTRSMSRRDDKVELSLIHQCKVRSYDVNWTVAVHTSDVIDNFTDMIPF